MKVLQELFDEVMNEIFSMENLMMMFISGRLKEHGIELTQKQEDHLRRQVQDLNENNLSIELDEYQLPSTDETTIDELSIALDYNEVDVDQFIEDIHEKTPLLITDVIEYSAKNLAKELIKDAPSMLKKRRRHSRSYSKHILKTWKKPLDLLEMFIVICTEAGLDFNLEVRNDDVTEFRFVIDVLMRLQARACQIAKEVLCLLLNGYADGAHARWRSLHEISAVSFMISSNEEDLAERYVHHDDIESYKAAIQYQEHCESLGYEPLTEEEISSLKSRYDGLRDKYGRSYCNSYGWASSILGKKNPTFKDIEESAGLQHLRPFYKLASHNVHANPKGVFHKLGLFSWERDLLLAGPSFAGLADPGQGTAISLMQITTTLLTSDQPNLDRLVLCNILLDLQNIISSEFIKVHQVLEDSEAA